MEKRKAISLKKYFTKTLISVGLGIISIILFWVILLYIMLGFGIALPANKGELEAREEIERQKKAGVFLSDITTDVYDYIYFEKNDEVKQSSLPKSKVEKTYQKYEDESKTYFTGDWIAYPNNTKCLFIWKNKSLFSNPILRKWLPSVDVTLLFSISISLVLFFIVIIRHLSKRFRNILAEMEDVSTQISQRNLEDSYIINTGIVEFNHALYSLDSMRTALRTSVQDEWKKDQKRKEEIAALTHDIKAPLTVIRGNAELLLEERQNKNDKELIQPVIDAEKRIQKYVDNLQYISNSDLKIEQKSITSEKKLIKNVMETLRPLSASKAIELIVSNDKSDSKLLINLDSISRALVNIGENAIRFTPIKGKVQIIITHTSNRVSFAFMDEGPGFTNEELVHAKDMFWKSDKSRMKSTNYGMGLSISEQIAKEYDGSIELKNSKIGAIVTINLEVENNVFY